MVDRAKEGPPEVTAVQSSETQKSQPSILEAIQTVLEALEPLSSEERSRVLGAAATFYGDAPVQVPASRMGERGVGEDTAGDRPVSLREFLNKAQPSTNAQRIATFALYRERYKGLEKFSRADILPCFAEAKESAPGNYDRDFAAAVKEGWIHEDGANSYLTSTGVTAVDAGFGGKAKPRGSAVSKKKKKTVAA